MLSTNVYLFVTVAPAPVILEEDQAPKCDTQKCVLPNCFCSSDGTAIPGGLNPKDVRRDSLHRSSHDLTDVLLKMQTPQMVVISMDDSLNQNNFASYRAVFNGRKNPNGCPIRGTFFLSHEYSNYNMIQQLYFDGHEIATYSVSHRRNLEEMGYEEWVKEQIGMREMLKYCLADLNKNVGYD